MNYNVSVSILMHSKCVAVYMYEPMVFEVLGIGTTQNHPSQIHLLVYQVQSVITENVFFFFGGACHLCITGDGLPLQASIRWQNGLWS